MITYPWFAPVMGTVFVLAIVWFISVIGPFFVGGPWVPMPVAKARRMLQLASVRPGETVYDLGSGDGRVLLLAAREFGARAVGIEIDPIRTVWSRLAIRALKLRGQVRVIRGNLFKVDLREADIVVVYLLPETHARLVPKLQRELKPGTRVVTLTFEMPTWQLAAKNDDIYVYRL